MEYEHQPVDLDGETAVVVGGTSGIGEAVSLSLASEGATVVPTSRDEERVESTAEAIRNRGGVALEATCDVANRDSLVAVREATVERFGGVDILVTSQGAISRQDTANAEQSEWDRVLDVALTGTFRACQVFGDAMGSGAIVTVSSLAARLALEGVAAYSAAKGGVESFTRVAARDLAPDVRVNAVAPGFVITPQNEHVYAEGTEKRRRIDERTPLGRVAERSEVAAAVTFLASDAASYVTGEVLTVDGGFAPSAL